MDHVTGLKCTICGNVYGVGEVEYVCPDHGEDGNLDVQYDYASIADKVQVEGLPEGPGMWRYKALLPIDYDALVPPLLVGDTPLYHVETVAREIGIRNLWVKDDGRNPTASLKDRASALLVAKAQAKGHKIMTTASTGNAGAALAGLAASVRQATVIFVPKTAPPAKITQLVVYGANVLLVDGTYDDAFELCLEATHEFGWYCRNTGYNPYTSEGKKTVSFEICEGLSGKKGLFENPDVVMVSVGDGNIISGVHKGLKDLVALGWIKAMPRIIGVQAEGSNAMYRAWSAGSNPVDMTPIDAQTVADSISAGLPRDRVKAMRAVTETDGAYLTVTDEEILVAIPALARATGVFAEPAGAATYAGLLKAAQDGRLGKEDRVVVLNTGNGLKDVASAQKAVGTARVIAPRLEEVAAVVKEMGIYGEKSGEAGKIGSRIE